MAAELFGKRLLNSLFYFAARSKSQEAFLSVVLLTVLGLSAVTESLGSHDSHGVCVQDARFASAIRPHQERRRAVSQSPRVR